MTACSIYVPKRQYGEAGRCRSTRAVKTIVVNDTPIKACVGHRRQIEGGGSPTVARRRR